MRVVKKYDSPTGIQQEQQQKEQEQKQKKQYDYGQFTGSVFNSMRLAALDCLARLKPNSLR